jgi:hypothetical protein
MKTITTQKARNLFMSNGFVSNSRKLLLIAAAAAVLPVARTNALVLWNESVNGDLSNTQASPNMFTLSSGVNAVIGSVGTGDTQDWLTLTVPTGFELSSIILASYQSSDVQGFTGFGAGPALAGSAVSAGSYIGYAHFGTAAGNGSLPVANLVGADILSIMANPLADPGSQGFTDPLQAGSYAFLIQQLGAATSYEFDYDVTPTPEPGTLALTGLAGGILFLYRRRKA